MRTNHIASPEAQAKKVKFRFRLELKRYNHCVASADSVDRGWEWHNQKGEASYVCNENK